MQKATFDDPSVQFTDTPLSSIATTSASSPSCAAEYSCEPSVKHRDAVHRGLPTSDGPSPITQIPPSLSAAHKECLTMADSGFPADIALRWRTTCKDRDVKIVLHQRRGYVDCPVAAGLGTAACTAQRGTVRTCPLRHLRTPINDHFPLPAHTIASWAPLHRVNRQG